MPPLKIPLELSISCQNLLNLDTFSKSDPMVVVYQFSSDGTRNEIGRTEYIKDTLNPKFIQKFRLTIILR